MVLLKQMTYSIGRLSQNQVYYSNNYQINDRTLETPHIAAWFVIIYSYVYGFFPILTEFDFSKINPISSWAKEKKLITMNVSDIYISI